MARAASGQLGTWTAMASPGRTRYPVGAPGLDAVVNGLDDVDATVPPGPLPAGPQALALHFKRRKVLRHRAPALSPTASACRNSEILDSSPPPGRGAQNTAIGFTGEPVARRSASGTMTDRNSYRPVLAHALASSAILALSTSHRPIATMPTKCTGSGTIS
jgi:hypothetical protein